MRIEIMDDGYNRMIGHIVDNIFYKKIIGSKHFYRKLDGIGIDALIFDGMILKQCDLVKILDQETSTLYSASPKLIKQRGHYRHHKPHRPQIIMSRDFWDSVNNYVPNNNNND